MSRRSSNVRGSRNSHSRKQTPKPRYYYEYDVERREHCPRPEKQKFETEREAEEQINTMYSRATRRTRQQHYLPERSYLCVCGYWHYTSAKFKDQW